MAAFIKKCLGGVFFSTALMACSQQQFSQQHSSIDDNAERLKAHPSQAYLKQYLSEVERIPNSTGWFEVLKLPNDVYAFWEPGHKEKVNSFLIVGRDKDVLYDTGMGIGSIANAIADVRAAENLPEKELMVINSHNHLDHNGGNSEFSTAWIYNDEWAIKKLTGGIPGGKAGGFLPYWDDFTDHEGVHLPEDFDLETFSIAPFPLENIRFLAEGDVVDLGDKQFTVLHPTSHSPDGIALYDKENKILFGGDTFYGADYLVADLEQLASDLELVEKLEIDWHYSSHKQQLVETMRHGYHLSVIRKIIKGEGKQSKTMFAGFELPVYELDGVSVTLAAQLLTY